MNINLCNYTTELFSKQRLLKYSIFCTNKETAQLLLLDSLFIFCQVLPSDRYSHYLHNEYVAFWQGGA